jgi:hypothetical protein
MRRPLPILAVLLAMQVVVTALLALRADPLSRSTPDVALITTPLGGADHITIDGPAQSTPARSTPAPGAADAAADAAKVELARRGANWTLSNYFDAPVKTSQVENLLTRLGGLKRGLPIATSDSALKRFHVTDHVFERRLTVGQGGKTLATVFLGTSAGVKDVDARTGGDAAVYAVEFSTYDLPTQPAEWFDKGLLDRAPDALKALDIDDPGHPTQTLQREPAAPAGSGSSSGSSSSGSSSSGSNTANSAATLWHETSAHSAQSISPQKAEELVRTLATIQVDAILGTQDKPEWQQSHPILRLSLRGADNQSETWTLSKPDSGDYRVLKSSAHPWYFSLSTSTASSLLSLIEPGQLTTAASVHHTEAHRQ